MEQALYRVVASGQLMAGKDKEAVVKELSQLLKTTPANAAKLVCGKPVPINKQLNKQTAEKYCMRLRQAGIQCGIQALPSKAAPVTQTKITTNAPIKQTVASNLSAGLSLVPKDDADPSENPTESNQPKVTAELSLMPSENTTSSPTLSTATTPELKPEQPQQNLPTPLPAHRMICPKCKTEQDNAKSCSSCGTDLEQYLTKLRMQEALKKQQQEHEQELQSVDESELMEIYVGEKYVEYYQDIFDKFDSNGGRYAFQFNLFALLVPFLWFVYRKMPIPAFVVGCMYAFLPSYLPLIAHVLGAVSANFLYYRQSNRVVEKIDISREGYEKQLAERGGVTPIPVVIGGVLSMLFIFAYISAQSFMPQLGTMQPNSTETQSSNDFSTQMKAIAEDDPELAIQMMGQSIQLAYTMRKSIGLTSELPSNKQQLMTEFEIPAQAFTDPWGSDIDYEGTASGFTLYSPGPDQNNDTDDDIHLEFDIAD
ncbi:hypothetical protein [Kaarinaea lacus]